MRPAAADTERGGGKHRVLHGEGAIVLCGDSAGIAGNDDHQRRLVEDAESLLFCDFPQGFDIRLDESAFTALFELQEQFRGSG